MERTPLEAVQLDYCAPRGIPLSVFQGRVVYPGDPQWTEDDMNAALGWQAEQYGKCQYGHRLDDTMGKDNFDQWNAEVTGHCDICRAVHRAAMIDAGRDDLDPQVGAQYRVWRDEPKDG